MSRSRLSSLFVTFAGLVPTATLSTIAAAQSAGQPGPAATNSGGDQPTGMQEVVVTAQFREESLQSTPLAI